MTLDRKTILDALVNALEPLDYVYSFWEGGAAGFDRADEWSDIDVQGFVDPEHVEDAFGVVDRVVEDLGGTIEKFRIPEPSWHGHSQCFYKLKDASPFLMIDLCFMREGTEADTFDVWQTHGVPQICFDKKGLVKEKKIDANEHAAMIMKRLETLKKGFEIFHILPLKETYRGNHVEAMWFYLGQTLRPMIEVLRMKHCPQRFNYFSRYVYYDLPPEVAERLERLTFFDPEEMPGIVDEVREWFWEVSGSISEEEIIKKLGQ